MQEESTTEVRTNLEMNEFVEITEAVEETEVTSEVSANISFLSEDISEANSLDVSQTYEREDYIAPSVNEVLASNANEAIDLSANEALSINDENSSNPNISENAQSRSDDNVLIISAEDNRSIVDETMVEDVDVSKENETSLERSNLDDMGLVRNESVSSLQSSNVENPEHLGLKITMRQLKLFSTPRLKSKPRLKKLMLRAMFSLTMVVSMKT